MSGSISPTSPPCYLLYITTGSWGVGLICTPGNLQLIFWKIKHAKKLNLRYNAVCPCITWLKSEGKKALLFSALSHHHSTDFKIKKSTKTSRPRKICWLSSQHCFIHSWSQGNLLRIKPPKQKFPTISSSHFLFHPKLYLKVIDWRYCPVCRPPLVPLPESVSGLRAEQLGSLFFLEVLDQWQCSISTCQVVASCEGQRGKNFSEWSEVQTVFFEIHKYTQRGTSHTHRY